MRSSCEYVVSSFSLSAVSLSLVCLFTFLVVAGRCVLFMCVVVGLVHRAYCWYGVLQETLLLGFGDILVLWLVFVGCILTAEVGDQEASGC